MMKTGFGQQRISRRRFLDTAGKGAALLGLGSVAAACGPLGGSGSEGDGSIRFITPADLGLERDLYKGFIREFEKQNPDIKVSVTFEAWEDYMTKLPTLLAGGVAPDVIHQHVSIVQDYGQRGALLDLTEYMKQDGVKPGDYIPALFDAFSNEGKVFGIPKDSAAWGIYYNKDMFDEAGLDYPADDWTLEDFRELARELTLDENGRPASDPGFDSKNIEQWGVSWVEPTPTLSENARAFVRAFGGDWYDEGYTETLITEDPVIEDFTMFHDMRCVDHSTPSPAQELGQGDPFRAGLTAMQVGFHSTDYFLREENVDFEYDVTFTPSGPGGQFVAVGCSGWAIPAQSGNKEAAWELVKYLTSEKVQKEIGSQKRWGVSRQGAIDAIVPENPISGFAKVHTDPLQGESDREVIAFKFPANQSRIKEIYTGNFDPIFVSCKSDDVSGAAASTKQQVDSALSES
jgi:multiple sugar transport system substrate-binding protein